MAKDWAANVKKYVPDADDGIIAGIVRYCGIALQKRDSSLVSFGDAAETKRVRENFLKKKLALTDSDDKLDTAIAKIGERMKGENFRNRVTVYYLLAEQFGKLQIFAKAAKAAKVPAASKKPATSTKVAAVATAAAGLAKAGASEAKATTSKAKPAKAGGAVAGAAGAVAAGAASGAKVVSEKASDAAGGVVKGAKAVGETAADVVGTVAAGALSGAKVVGEKAADAAEVAVKGAKAVGETAADAVGAVASGAKAVGETAVGAAEAAGAAVASAAGVAAGKVGSGAAQALKGGLPDDKEDGGSGMSWLLWLALIAVVLGVLWWLFFGRPAASSDSSITTEQNAAPTVGEVAAPPAEGTVAIPTGAGVTTESRDGKPVVKVYFDTGKTDIVPAFGPAANGLKAYIDSHAGSSLAISGYNDKTGNAAANAALSKKRAQAVQAALVASGIAESAAMLVKPADTTDAKADDAAARRVEVVVQ